MDGNTSIRIFAHIRVIVSIQKYGGLIFNFQSSEEHQVNSRIRFDRIYLIDWNSNGLTKFNIKQNFAHLISSNATNDQYNSDNIAKRIGTQFDITRSKNI